VPHRLPDQWLSHWISPVEARPLTAERPGYLLSGSFGAPGDVTEATLYATALGVYEIFVNGTRVGDEELTPGSTSYDRTLYAQSYDITALVREGENDIEILLSDGWYRGRTGSTQRQNSWGSVTAALAQIELETASGTRLVVGTDDTWTSRRSRIVRADLITGQTTDFSVETPEKRSAVRMDLVQPPAPTLSPAPPVRRIAELTPVSIRSIEQNISIVDFGQNISGWVRLVDLGTTGSQTTLEYGEHLAPNGDLTTAHLDTSTPRGEHIRFHQTDQVIAGPGGDTFEPRHTIHGFRYARIAHPGRHLDPGSIAAVVVHTDLDRTGWFTSSDERLNRLHDTAVRTFLGNAVDVPTDCPTRERLGWTGDFQIFAPTAAHLFDISGFSKKWLQAVGDDQYDDGCLSMFSPDSERMRTNPTHPDREGGGSAGWGDAAVDVPWALYRHYGDHDILDSSWPSMKAWVEFALRAAREHRHPTREARSPIPAPHEQYIWDGTFHFGEWLEPRTSTAAEVDVAAAFQALIAADKGEVGTAYLYRSTSRLSQIAHALGRETDATHYREIASRIRNAWIEEFLNDGGHTAADTQASYVRAIDFDLIPGPLRSRAADRLVELISDADNHLSTGFLATGTLLDVLADTGNGELAYALLTQTGVPSWMEMLERGGTTFWENWDGVDVNGNATQGSLNHYSKGAAMRFLYTHVVGLRQTQNSIGWAEFVVKPVLGGELTHASARLLTVRGFIEAAWHRTATELSLTVTVPEGCRATAMLPGQPPVRLPPGTSTTRGRSPNLPRLKSHEGKKIHDGRIQSQIRESIPVGCCFLRASDRR
jgi:alpha-L-rhamnosidase